LHSITVTCDAVQQFNCSQLDNQTSPELSAISGQNSFSVIFTIPVTLGWISQRQTFSCVKQAFKGQMPFLLPNQQCFEEMYICI